MLNELFKAIDAKDSKTFTSFLSPDCRFRFGNMPEVVGSEDIESFVGGFFESIAALSHRIDQRFELPGNLICHGEVTYTRHDGSTLSVPFSNIFGLDEFGIRDYLIFADTSALYP
jgi:hypothetical protein